jgi:hypothetical protein
MDESEKNGLTKWLISPLNVLYHIKASTFGWAAGAVFIAYTIYSGLTKEPAKHDQSTHVVTAIILFYLLKFALYRLSATLTPTHSSAHDS